MEGTTPRLGVCPQAGLMNNVEAMNRLRHMRPEEFAPEVRVMPFELAAERKAPGNSLGKNVNNPRMAISGRFYNRADIVGLENPFQDFQLFVWIALGRKRLDRLIEQH